jgi:hypothetical protein
MEVIHIKNKAQLLKTLERFHTYDLSRQKLQMNDTVAYTYNPIFEFIIKYTHHYTAHSENRLPRHTPMTPMTSPNITQPPSHSPETSRDPSYIPITT